MFVVPKFNILFLQKPFIITDSKLVKSAEKWTLTYLEKYMGNGAFTVYVSRNHKFKYFDEKKVNNYKGDFTPPIKKVDMKLPEFIKKLKEWKRGEER